MILSIAILSIMGAFPTSENVDSTRICVRDEQTQLLLSDVQLIDSTGSIRMLGHGCAESAAGAYKFRRLGYRSRTVVISSDSSSQLVYLARLATAQRLATAHVSASRNDAVMSVENAIARTSATVNIGVEMSRGVKDMSGLVAALPYASATSARGELGLNLRGARSNGAAVTLDGLALNDPSTGVANVADLPLILLQSATLVLGADALGFGSGASGGVLALHSTSARAISATVGSFGARRLEGTWNSTRHERLFYGAASVQQSNNDFAFDNGVASSTSSSVSSASISERRVNNDNQTISVAVGAVGGRAQSMILASTTERGMVGAVNVLAYDNDRSRASKLMLRSQLVLPALRISGGLRGFDLSYRDPTRPKLDTHSRSWAMDIETGGDVRRSVGLSWRTGVGGDVISGSGNISQTRTRAFVGSEMVRSYGATSVQLGARIDGVKELALLPSFSASVDHLIFRTERSVGELSILKVGLRASQSVRVPTLYDLYFSSPQRIFVRTLQPERVLFDIELNSHAELASGVGKLVVHGALIARDTKNAIVWFPGNFGWSPANVGRERVRGLEGLMSLDSRYTSLSAWMSAYNTDLAVENLHIPTPYIPRLSAGSKATVQIAGTSLGASLRFTGARPYTVGPANRDFELEPTSLLGVFASQRFVLSLDKHRLSRLGMLVMFGIDNATNELWQSVQGFPSPGRSWSLSVTINPASNP